MVDDSFVVSLRQKIVDIEKEIDEKLWEDPFGDITFLEKELNRLKELEELGDVWVPSF